MTRRGEAALYGALVAVARVVLVVVVGARRLLPHVGGDDARVHFAEQAAAVEARQLSLRTEALGHRALVVVGDFVDAVDGARHRGLGLERRRGAVLGVGGAVGQRGAGGRRVRGRVLGARAARAEQLGVQETIIAEAGVSVVHFAVDHHEADRLLGGHGFLSGKLFVGDAVFGGRILCVRPALGADGVDGAEVDVAGGGRGAGAGRGARRGGGADAGRRRHAREVPAPRGAGATLAERGLLDAGVFDHLRVRDVVYIRR